MSGGVRRAVLVWSEPWQTMVPDYTYDEIREFLPTIILAGERVHPSPYLQMGYVNWRMWGITKQWHWRDLVRYLPTRQGLICAHCLGLGFEIGECPGPSEFHVPTIPTPSPLVNHSVHNRDSGSRNPYHPSRKHRRK